MIMLWSRDGFFRCFPSDGHGTRDAKNDGAAGPEKWVCGWARPESARSTGACGLFGVRRGIPPQAAVRRPYGIALALTGLATDHLFVVRRGVADSGGCPLGVATLARG